MRIFIASIFSNFPAYIYPTKSMEFPSRYACSMCFISSQRVVFVWVLVLRVIVRECIVSRSDSSFWTMRMMPAYTGISSSHLRNAFCASILAVSNPLST